VKEKDAEPAEADQKEQTDQAKPAKPAKSKAGRGRAAPEAVLLVVGLLMAMLFLFALHCTWVTSNAYSSPSVVLSTNVGLPLAESRRRHDMCVF
jgi:dolichyl-diphosphooligosaccharide--protein glycosyltransferase